MWYQKWQFLEEVALKIGAKFYTGIGSRKTPENVLTKMVKIAEIMAKKGYILRSGGADGADTAFENGCDQANGAKEIYVPWEGFNGVFDGISVTGNEEEAEKIASKFHPAWHKCSQGAKKMHIRNVYQILGADLKTPTQGVVCWTPEGRGGGGTGQALRIAKHFGIPINDLGEEVNLQKITMWIKRHS